MGYYLEGYGALTIKAANVPAALKAVHQLNTDDEHKRGGQYPPTLVKPADSTSRGNPNKWFSWMPWNYDETLTTLPEVLEELGFYTETSPDGDITIGSYDTKAGNEENFLDALAPYIEPGQYFWEGEDGHKWRDTYANGSRTQHIGTIIYS